jgi:hypothetical protein
MNDPSDDAESPGIRNPGGFFEVLWPWFGHFATDAQSIFHAKVTTQVCQKSRFQFEDSEQPLPFICSSCEYPRSRLL